MGTTDSYFLIGLPDRMIILLIIEGSVVPVLLPFELIRVVFAVHEDAVIVIHVHRLRPLDLESAAIISGQSGVQGDRDRFAVRACDHGIHDISLGKLQLCRVRERIVPAQHIFAQSRRL